jgi:hypothetical protein
MLAIAHNVAVNDCPRRYSRNTADERRDVLHYVTLETHDHVPWLEADQRGWTLRNDSLDENPEGLIMRFQLETEPVA